MGFIATDRLEDIMKLEEINALLNLFIITTIKKKTLQETIKEEINIFLSDKRRVSLCV